MGLSFSLMIDLASISMETVHFQTHGSSRSLSDLASNSQWKRASSDRISNATDTLAVCPVFFESKKRDEQTLNQIPRRATWF